MVVQARWVDMGGAVWDKTVDAVYKPRNRHAMVVQAMMGLESTDIKHLILDIQASV